MEVHQNSAEPWTVTLIDTGETTLTGGRLKRVYDYVKNEEAFCFTYGDGVSDVNITELLKFHHYQGKLATLTATRPAGRYGALTLNAKGTTVNYFQEKPDGDDGWINGGYFVLSPKVISYIQNDHTPWESEPLIRLAEEGELAAFQHKGFWQPMDTLREKNLLNELWDSEKAPWKVW